MWVKIIIKFHSYLSNMAQRLVCVLESHTWIGKLRDPRKFNITKPHL